MGLAEDLGAGPIPLDPVPFIALIEEHPQHLPIVPRQAIGGPTTKEYTIHTTYAWRSVMPSAKEIVEQAETLPVEDRLLVVDSLLRTLNPPDAEVDRKWAEVAKRRLAELRSGRVTPLPGAEVLARARERFAR